MLPSNSFVVLRCWTLPKSHTRCGKFWNVCRSLTHFPYNYKKVNTNELNDSPNRNTHPHTLNDFTTIEVTCAWNLLFHLSILLSIYGVPTFAFRAVCPYWVSVAAAVVAMETEVSNGRADEMFSPRSRLTNINSQRNWAELRVIQIKHAGEGAGDANYNINLFWCQHCCF